MKSWQKKIGGLFILGAGTLIAGIMALFVYMGLSATPIHPNPLEIPTTQSSASARWTEKADRARQIVRTAAAEQNLPGVSVAVGVGGEIVWVEGFGWADLDARVPVSPAMRFRIGTASTVLTSAAVGLLLEKDRLNLDDEIQLHVPEFPKKEWPVTVRQLMAHLAGVRNDGGDEGPLFSERCERPVEGLPHFADHGLLFEPGTEFRYSSYGWILLSAAVEAAAGEPFLPFMQKQIFEPLDMRDTVPDAGAESSSARAPSYFPKFAADPRYGPDPMRELNLSCYAGASVFLSTPSDLVRFGMAVNSGKLLKPDTVQRLLASQRLPSGEETGYGLGWDLETVRLADQEVQIAGHDGDLLGGRVASLMMLRERRIVVAVTSNTSYADTFALASRIAEVFLEQASNPVRK
jgi:CubicO group peptidase (beta-lactamase class C family)